MRIEYGHSDIQRIGKTRKEKQQNCLRKRKTINLLNSSQEESSRDGAGYLVVIVYLHQKSGLFKIIIITKLDKG